MTPLDLLAWFGWIFFPLFLVCFWQWGKCLNTCREVNELNKEVCETNRALVIVLFHGRDDEI